MMLYENMFRVMLEQNSIMPFIPQILLVDNNKEKLIFHWKEALYFLTNIKNIIIRRN